MKNYVRMIDKLSKEQDKPLSEDRKTDSKRKRAKLGIRIEEIGEQINTIYNVAEEIKEHGITDPIINKEGKCYYCGEAIDIENERCVIYKSMRNGTISLFHNICWLNTQTIGMADPVAIIGRSIEKQTERTK